MTMLRVMVWQLMIVDSDLLQRRIGGSLFPAQHKLMKRAHLISTAPTVEHLISTLCTTLPWPTVERDP